jgi:hypothetical protein
MTTTVAKTVTTISAIVIPFLAMAFFVEDRYLNAADFESYQEQTAKQFTLVQQQFAEQRHLQIEDKVFELEYKVNSNTASELDRLLLERYKRELDTLNSRPTR